VGAVVEEIEVVTQAYVQCGNFLVILVVSGITQAWLVLQADDLQY
jgi:hypothetical protein